MRLRDRLAGICRADWIALACLAGLWTIPLLLIGTHGDFPLNDDWAYARTVRALVTTGRFERVPWTWVPLVTQALIGGAFASVAGFSHSALRASGCFMGGLGVLGSYVLCRQAGARPALATLAAATVGLNPVWLNLSYTFMTDVPFATLVTWSLVAGVRAGRLDSWPALGSATLLALAAILTRQTGLAIPLAFALSIWAAAPRSRRAWVLGLVSIGAVVGVYAGVESLLLSREGSKLYTFTDYRQVFLTNPTLLFQIAKNGVVTAIYLGAFLLPVTLLKARRGSAGLLHGAAWAGALVAVLGVWRMHLALPPGINVIRNLGLGPVGMRGADALPSLGPGLWWILTAAGGAGAGLAAALALRDLAHRWRVGEWSAGRLLLLALPLVYLAPQIARSPYFDRYLMAVLPALVAFVSSAYVGDSPPARWRWAAASTVLAGLAAFGIAGTHDYLERARTKWALCDELFARGISDRQIDAGQEFNGWFMDFEHPFRTTVRLWVYDDEYVLSASPRREGYRVDARRSYRRWLPPGRESVWVLHRERPPEGDSP
ncbi:MAG: glycosyltransferase family 39 protein [Myxococcota bacterium]